VNDESQQQPVHLPERCGGISRAFSARWRERDIFRIASSRELSGSQRPHCSGLNMVDPFHGDMPSAEGV
jgi:hypothetical protein